MKNRFISRLFILLLSGAGGLTVYNYTGNDITLEDGTAIKTEQLQEHLTKKYKDRPIANTPLTIYLHHTVTSRDATIEDINRIHLANGWARISYHIGVNYEGEAIMINDIEKLTYHTKGNNTKGISIVLIGNYEEYYPSKEMIATTRAIIKALCDSDLNIVGIKGHKDVKATLCPGRYAYTEFKDLFY